MQTTLENPGIADWRTYRLTAALGSLRPLENRLEVLWADGRVSPFHHQWLRDNCPCSECVYSVTREQVLEIIDVPASLAPSRASLDQGQLCIDWQDGHRSRFDPGWLRAHAYDDASRAERLAAHQTTRVWRRDFEVPVYQHDHLMDDDSALLEWMLALRDLGLSRVDGVPTAPGSLNRIAQRIAFIRETNFGVLFDVKSKAAAADSNAYTAFNLPLHTDLPTRELQPGLQFLHCLVNNADGGDSVFVDGFAIAEALRDEAPEDFRTLCEMPIEFRNKDRRSDYRCLAPVIALDARGEISEIRIANFLRGPFDAPAERMDALYHAWRAFLTLTRDARFRLQQKLRAGQMWCFDNRRTLHARTAFDPASGERHLQGCYIDRDELLSRILVLQRER
ncbi:gamma-butyrobetaine dioxygenase [Pseudomonas nitroreducens]|uniref:gamma-butyrobetaine dioxygenase n=1 Tax=Pseudomonas nitroreducens TaxID=46680 RepID=UPI00209FA90B|nr:gamma-butyrobetaine dioxygenase [Pseudomonas nitroreducens]MCP1621440.1 gamma-butyrobetaine dioxygenase [Pseudomonas nitroreducens]